MGCKNTFLWNLELLWVGNNYNSDLKYNLLGIPYAIFITPAEDLIVYAPA